MSHITITAVDIHDTANPALAQGWTATGTTGGAKSITCQATLNGMSIDAGSADISGIGWTWKTSTEFSPDGKFVLTATDPDGKVDGAKFEETLPKA